MFNIIYYLITMRAISRNTYKTFMKKYKLKLSIKIDGKYKPKSSKQMSKEIYEYESNYDVPLPGLYYF